MLTFVQPAAKPIRAMGGFFAMTADVFVTAVRQPFAWREYLLQCWFVARVSMVPAIALVIPYTVLITFTVNTLLAELGAADYSGAGSSFTVITSIAPVANVLVIAGAGATAICADLGARTIREELDAMRVIGVDPIQALVVPRVLATTTVTLLLAAPVIAIGLLSAFLFAVYGQHVSPGAFVDHLSLIIGFPNVVVSITKSTIFGLTGGLIACYMGTTVSGGPAGVGRAVNETVVYAFVTMFWINFMADAITIPLLLK